MKLLICTQKVDRKDTTLGFFHTWIFRLAQEFEEVSVICLEKGEHDLPHNVSVYSLGKEEKKSKFTYISKFFGYIFKFRNTYDVVLVHMNEEYVLMGGVFWKLLGKKVYMWRNHPKGSLATRTAVWLSDKVFYTSNASFTARFEKAIRMPAGIDTELFVPIPSIVRTKYSVAMVGRIAPIKHVLEGIQAIESLVQSGFQVSLIIVGNPGEKDTEYMKSLQLYVEKRDLGTSIKFEAGVSQEKLPEVYSRFDISLNLTDDGSFDKTIVEAVSCGVVPIVSSKSFQKLLPEECMTELSTEAIAESIKHMCEPHVRSVVQEKLRAFVESQSLDALLKKLISEMYV